MARRKYEWERLEGRMLRLSQEYAGLRERLQKMRSRCPHAEKTKLKQGYRCRLCGLVMDEE